MILKKVSVSKVLHFKTNTKLPQMGTSSSNTIAITNHELKKLISQN